MNHQIAEYHHEYGTISVFDKGILIEGRNGVTLFLGEQFIANYELYCSFIDLVSEGIVIKIGGPVTEREDEKSEFELYQLGKDLFVLTSDDEDEEDYITADVSFLRLLGSAAVVAAVDGSFESGVEYENWAIDGSFPWTDLGFTINEQGFEVYYEDDEEVRYFSTERADRNLWFRSLAVAEKMLDTDAGVENDSWQIIGVESSEKRVILELEADRVLFSLHDPTMPGANASFYFDDVTLFAIRILLTRIWVFEPPELEVEIYGLSDDEEDED